MPVRKKKDVCLFRCKTILSMYFKTAEVDIMIHN